MINTTVSKFKPASQKLALSLSLSLNLISLVKKPTKVAKKALDQGTLCGNRCSGLEGSTTWSSTRVAVRDYQAKPKVACRDSFEQSPFFSVSLAPCPPAEERWRFSLINSLLERPPPLPLGAATEFYENSAFSRIIFAFGPLKAIKTKKAINQLADVRDVRGLPVMTSDRRPSSGNRHHQQKSSLSSYRVRVRGKTRVSSIIKNETRRLSFGSPRIMPLMTLIVSMTKQHQKQTRPCKVLEDLRR